MRNIKTVAGLFGTQNHYDESGNHVGTSVHGLFGDSWSHYDNEGNFIGYSDPGIFADAVHHDADGHFVGSSYDAFGFEEHYDADGDLFGVSIDTPWGASTDLF